MKRAKGVVAKGVVAKAGTVMAAAALLTTLAASPAVFAASTTNTSTTSTSTDQLVALGDSITFGYNLGNNQSPYPGAFPYVLAKAEGLSATSVNDQGVPGWTSGQLLAALQAGKYTSALKQAKIVTVDIGSNDLLHAASRLVLEAETGQPVVPKLQDRLALQQGLDSIKTNLSQIIAAVKQQAPNAQILLYNLYNPFVSGTSLASVAESMVSGANHIIAEAAAQSNVTLVHAHAAFAGNQANYVLPLDVHPTVAGQNALATAAEDALTTTYVSPTGSDSTGDGTMSNPYRTIAYAISKTPEGSTVALEPGTYHESLAITKSLVLTSTNPLDPNTVKGTILDATGETNAITITGQGASGTVIRGITIENANNHGIWASNTNNLAIVGNLITKNGTNGNGAAENKPLLLDGTSYSLVANNSVMGNLADGGIAVTDLGALDPGASKAAQPTTSTTTPDAAISNWIVGNTIEGNRDGSGITVAAYNPGEGVSGNIVKNNTVSNGMAGIIIAADTPNSSATNNQVVGNTIENNLIPGVIVHSNAPGDIITGTLISDNTLSGNGPDPQVKLAQKTAIALIGAVTPVSDTVITANHLSNEQIGVWGSNTSGAVLANNHVDATVSAPTSGVSQLNPNQRVFFLNGKETGIVGSVVYKNTTYVPIWYLMSALQTLGIHSAWNGRHWNMTNNTSVDTAFSMLSQVQGPDTIYFNGTLIQHFTGIAEKDANSGKPTTYMSLYQVQQILNAMGVQASWDGTTLQLTTQS